MSESLELIIGWGGIVFLLAAIFRTIAYFILRGQRKRKEACVMHTSGIIVEVICDHVGSSNAKSYFPVVEYQAGGRVRRMSSNFGTDDKHFFQEGQTVEVYYDPYNCETFRIPELEKEFGSVAKIFTIVSYIMIAVGMVVCIYIVII